MLTCDHCRAALLDRHYGLLDAADAAAVDAHLAGCPACQAEQIAVERFGRLLAAAARTEFPDVRFVAPADTRLGRDADSARTSALRCVAPCRGLGRRGRGSCWRSASRLRLHVATTARQQIRVGTAREKHRQVGRTNAASRPRGTRRPKFAAASADAAKGASRVPVGPDDAGCEAQRGRAASVGAKQLNFVITGPPTVQAGAPAEYRIETRDRDRPAGPGHVSYRVKDQANGSGRAENEPIADRRGSDDQAAADAAADAEPRTVSRSRGGKARRRRRPSCASNSSSPPRSMSRT